MQKKCENSSTFFGLFLKIQEGNPLNWKITKCDVKFRTAPRAGYGTGENVLSHFSIVKAQIF